MKDALAKISMRLGRNFNPSIRWSDTAQKIRMGDIELSIWMSKEKRNDVSNELQTEPMKG